MSDVEINAETVIVQNESEGDEWQENEPTLTTTDSNPLETNSPTGEPEVIAEAAETVAQAAAEVALAAAMVTQTEAADDPTNSTLETILSEIQEVKLRLAVLESPPAAEVIPSDSALEAPSLASEKETVESVTVEAEPVRTKNPPPSEGRASQREHLWRKNRLRNR